MILLEISTGILISSMSDHGRVGHREVGHGTLGHGVVGHRAVGQSDVGLMITYLLHNLHVLR